LGHRAAGQHLPRRADPYEYLPAATGGGGVGPPGGQPGNDRLADIGRQRQLVLPVALAVDGDHAAPPVNVVQPQRRGLGRTQPQPHQHRQDRQVPPPHRGVPIAGRQQRRDLAVVQRLGHPGQLPAGHRRHHGRQRLVDEPLDVQEPQQRP
jgi:hypothetical protein